MDHVRLASRPEPVAGRGQVRLRMRAAALNYRDLLVPQRGYGQRMQQLATQLGLDDITVWTGMVSGAEKWGAFRCAEAFALPSHQENFGISVAESLACGVPVLISNQVNIWREIEQDRAGLVGDDTQAATEALLTQWLAMPQAEWQAMRGRAEACFNARFRIDRAADSLIHAMLQQGLSARVQADALPGQPAPLSTPR